MNSTSPEIKRETLSRVERNPIGWPVVAGAVLFAHLASYYVASAFAPSMNQYVLQPAFWFVPAALVVLTLGWSAIRNSLAMNDLTMTAITIGIANVIVLMFAGLVFGFARSPYAHDPIALLQNFWYVGALLVAGEVARWYIVQSLVHRGEGVALVICWLTMSIASFGFNSVQRFSDPLSAFEISGGVILPMLALQFLATYLALRGGLSASLSYVGIVTYAEWFAPILPDLTWMAAAAIGVMVPVFGLLAAQPKDDLDERTSEDTRVGPSPSLLAVAAIVVLFLWLNTGIIGFKPTIVHGVSMEPTYYTGDLVISEDVDASSLEVGNVIVFRNGPLNVVHRIIEVRNGENGLEFITHGDNNDAPDRPVPAKDVIGKVTVSVPKVGWPAVAIKRVLGSVIG